MYYDMDINYILKELNVFISLIVLYKVNILSWFLKLLNNKIIH